MTTVSSGQTLQISGGESSASVIVLSGGTLEVLSGGTANITENSGGIDAIFSGGTAFRKAARLRAASRSAPTGPSRFETAMFSAVTLRMRVRVLTFTEAAPPSPQPSITQTRMSGVVTPLARPSITVVPRMS